MLKKPCLDCGQPADGNRCPEHQLANTRKREQARAGTRNRSYDRGDYRRRAALVRAGASRCYLCGEGSKPDDPWQADHLIPIQKNGGGEGPLLAAHRSCNISRANKIRAGKPDPAANALRKREAGRQRHQPTSPANASDQGDPRAHKQPNTHNTADTADNQPHDAT